MAIQNRYPIQPDGLSVPVLIGLDGTDTQKLVQSGQNVPAPLLARGLLDTGSNFTAAAPWIFQGLGLTKLATSSSHTAAGLVPTGIYCVSITILASLHTSGPSFTIPTILVSELTTKLPGTDVLVGLNVLRELILVLDGPAQQFTLMF